MSYFGRFREDCLDGLAVLPLSGFSALRPDENRVRRLCRQFGSARARDMPRQCRRESTGLERPEPPCSVSTPRRGRSTTTTVLVYSTKAVTRHRVVMTEVTGYGCICESLTLLSWKIREPVVSRTLLGEWQVKKQSCRRKTERKKKSSINTRRFPANRTVA